MAILQLDGLEFGNGTELDSYYDIVPENTVMVFYQSAAPTGWTQDNSQSDKFLRVVDR